MRKIFGIMSVLALSVVTSLPLAACTNEFNDPNIYRITVVTDGHSITDQSFNEAAYKAALQFKRDYNTWSATSTDPELDKNKKVVISWDNPQLTTLDSLLSAYNKAVFINSKVIIASGFLHHEALVRAQNTFLKNKDVKIIFVDGATPEVPFANRKLAGLQYKAEQSGFLAGLAGAIWLTAHADNYGGLDNLKMTTYGGIDSAVVTNYMYGYYWAIRLFNDKTASNPIQDKLLEWVKILNPTFTGELPNIEFVKISNDEQFTGNFVQGHEKSKAINEALIQAGSDIIFPVAGPQTEDTLAALQKTKYGKIIGVDTDQQQQYPQAAERFITSAEKDLNNSINFMLWKSVGRFQTPDDHKEDKDAWKVFKKSEEYYGGKGFTGIAPNKAIKDGEKDIYTPLLALAGEDLLDKVSKTWQRVLKNNKDYWKNGITNAYNPFA